MPDKVSLNLAEDGDARTGMLKAKTAEKWLDLGIIGPTAHR